ncbi:DUF2141 domain-containing protein [Hymenobacter sp. HMF4947]|uniref:DUF2141 domain-containing protein n=1 Tax=Hymenobacter ginkgonis TaxID=2682976 RepID=A0A7K1TCT0_9BACT|nr:DUF2141 domain-containing protein [Hymenobacter ginkgonis]MVN75991.1 DUF2141 domain-containing protein [Hymenobacter ginkgonis]
MNALPLAALLLGSLTLGATVPAPSPAPAVATQKVTLLIADLASTQSVVKLNFYNDPETFLKSGQHALHLEVRPEGKNDIALPVDLAPGEWAVALSQDTNNNDKLDKNFLGIPTEPFAFPNNIKPRLAAPTFQECKFTVTGPGQVVNIVTWNNL